MPTGTHSGCKMWCHTPHDKFSMYTMTSGKAWFLENKMQYSKSSKHFPGLILFGELMTVILNSIYINACTETETYEYCILVWKSSLMTHMSMRPRAVLYIWPPRLHTDIQALKHVTRNAPISWLPQTNCSCRWDLSRERWISFLIKTVIRVRNQWQYKTSLSHTHIND